MKVYKFGGASVKDADGVRNLKRVLDITGDKALLIVVSAMGKMTNHLEKVVSAYLSQDDALESLLIDFESYHLQILNDLFPNASHPVYSSVKDRIQRLRNFLDANRSRKHV